MKSKLNCWKALAAAGLFAASGSCAFGLTVTLSAGTWQAGSGGEFKATASDDSLDAYIDSYSPLTGSSAANTFQTFCLEYQEHFSYGTSYSAQVSGAAIRGGTATQDPISVGTGWLYSQFAEGTLANYNFGGTTAQRKTSAGLLQNAIWYLEGERSLAQVAGGNIFITMAVAQFGATSPSLSPNSGGIGAAAEDSGNTYGVFALNLGPFPGSTAVSQDQLIYRKSANQRVPDGGTSVLLLGVGLAGLGALQRKSAKKS